MTDLEGCAEKADDEGRDLVGQVISLGDGIVLSDRFPDEVGQRRAELVVLTESSVVLLNAPVELGAKPFTSGRNVEIADEFRNGAR